NLASSAIQQRACLRTDLSPVPAVLANETRLGQVFVNLLVNAAQAIAEGAAARNEVRVVSRTDDAGRAVVEVHDTGSGIPPEIMGRLFDPFFTTKPVGEGTGLGLSICHGIVASLGGALAVASDAFERLSAGERFDLILCDLMMPGMTGMDLHEGLSMVSPANAAKMVFLTGGAFTARAQAFLSEVSNARLDKPFDPTSLRRFVAISLENRGPGLERISG